MLPKRNKLSRKTFPSHKDPKFSWVGEAIRINAYRTQEKEAIPRFAVIVAKRLSDSAPARNGFKREVIGAIEMEMGRLNGLPYQKYVILPKGHLRTIKREQIEGDIGTFLLARHQQ